MPYSVLGDNVIYNDKKQLFNLQKFFINYKDEKINCIIFDNPQKDIADILSEFKNVNIIESKISSNLIDNINKSDLTVLFCKIGKTDTDLYKSVKEILQLHNKKIAQEILI